MRTMNKYDVTALGELLVDMVEGPVSEQRNMTFEACPGGAPCNVLALLAKAGHRTAFIGKVGDDFLGHMLGDTLEKVGIDTTGLLYDKEAKTTLAFVHRKADGDRDFSFYRNPGADMLLREDEIDTSLIGASRIFHFGSLSMTSESVRRATRRAVEYAHEQGLLVSFDPNLREPLWDSMENAREQILWGLKNCDILKISDNEVEFMTGLSDMETAIDRIKEMTSARAVFVTLGPGGSIGWCGRNNVKCEGEKLDLVVDTTGAGDTFMGVVLHCILEGGMEPDDDELLGILTLANHTAARVTQVKGALKVMPEI